MRYLVTGCAGFIGSKVTETLVTEGHAVVGVDNLNDAYDLRLKEWRLAQLSRRKQFQFVHADVARMAELRPIFRGEPFDGIVNLAARAGVRQSVKDPWVYVDTNVTGGLNLLELCRRHDVRRYLLASTSSLYGMRNERPFRETAETDHPLSPYAASKKAAESLAATYAHLYKFNAPVVRYFTVYGPAGRPDMSMYRFIRWIAEGDPIVVYGDGSQERDFTYVDDIARGTVRALEHVHGFEVINLGSDRPIRLHAMIATIERQLGLTAVLDYRPAHKADMQATWADITKARELLGWAPQVSFEEGVRKSVEWYYKNRDWAKNIDVGPV